MTTETRAAGSIAWTPQRVQVTVGLMVAIFVTAMDTSVVATAVPTIAGELGGFALYPWLISGYLLTSTTTVPLWGRMADIQGRGRMLLLGLAWFVATSLLCAVAPGMAWLVAFRALQGIGAGCLLPVALTTVGDLFTLEQRARVQGLFSSVWAVAAFAGPAVGAVFVSTIGWRWIFLVNLPIGAVAAVLLWRLRDAPPAAERGRLDYVGALTLTAGVALVLFGLDGGGAGASPSWPVIAAGVLALALFAIAQRRADQPTIPFSLLRHRVIGPATVAAALAGTVMFSLNGFLPIYVQGVLGASPFVAGAVVAAASVGWTVTAMFSGRFLLRFGYQRMVAAGALCMAAGGAGFAIQPPGAGIGWVAGAALAIGLGMGLLQTPLLIVIQSEVDWSTRGVATALNQFSRTIGGAVGVALLGVLLSAQARAAAIAHGVDPQRVANPLSSTGHLDAVTAPLVSDALQVVFRVLFAVSLATVAVAVGILVTTRPTETTGRAPDTGGDG